MLTKESIRTHLLDKRKTLSLGVQQSAAKKITQRIFSLEVFRSARNIALYHAVRGEVNLTAVWEEAYQLGKKTAFPVIPPQPDKKIMQFKEASPKAVLNENRFHIKEPSEEAAIMPIDSMDCLFIPLVGFDTKGYRLGMGQGYYDCTLASHKHKPCCIGVAYHFQHVPCIPHDAWDIPLDVVVTEQEIFSF